MHLLTGLLADPNITEIMANHPKHLAVLETAAQRAAPIAPRILEAMATETVDSDGQARETVVYFYGNDLRAAQARLGELRRRFRLHPLWIAHAMLRRRVRRAGRRPLCDRTSPGR